MNKEALKERPTGNLFVECSLSEQISEIRNACKAPNENRARTRKKPNQKSLGSITQKLRTIKSRLLNSSTFSLLIIISCNALLHK